MWRNYVKQFIFWEDRSYYLRASLRNSCIVGMFFAIFELIIWRSTGSSNPEEFLRSMYLIHFVMIPTMLHFVCIWAMANRRNRNRDLQLRSINGFPPLFPPLTKRHFFTHDLFWIEMYVICIVTIYTLFLADNFILKEIAFFFVCLQIIPALTIIQVGVYEGWFGKSLVSSARR